jgi:ABC-type uncharacterized transport system involved in gliding motility auxiliary subunit
MNQPSNSIGSKRLFGVSALIVLAIAFVAFTIIMTFVLRGARFDLTQNKLYTIAPGTSRVVNSLDEPINLYFYFSDKATAGSPEIRSYAQRVRELLQELQQRSHGKLHLSVIDPQPFSEDEDRAGELGLTPVSVTQGSEPIYFGLAGTNSTDGKQTIGFFQPNKEEFLEYDVATMIYRLAHPKHPIVGVIAGLPVAPAFDQNSGRMSEGWAIMSQLSELFDLRMLTPDVHTIDPNVDLLLLIHPKQLTPGTLFAIDQFVMRGGKLLLFVDPQSEQDPAGAGPMGMMGGAPGERTSDLEPLLKAWGIEFDPRQVVGDRNLALTVALRQGQQPSPNIAIPGLNADSMTQKDVVTSGLKTINMMTPGALKPAKGTEANFEPLLQSSNDAALIPVERFASIAETGGLLQDFKPTSERYVIAARVHGKLKSAFPNGPPGGAEQKLSAPVLKESATDANLIVVADTDMLADPLWVRSQNVFGQRVAVAWANNGDFVSNALDNLTGSSDLISVRGRQSYFRPFTRVEALRRETDERMKSKEEELNRELTETESKLTALQAGRKGTGALVLSPEQEQELQRFQQERTRIRKELREVRRGLDVKIENLGVALKWLNIVLVPFLILIVAVVIAAVRGSRLRAGRAAAAGT